MGAIMSHEMFSVTVHMRKLRERAGLSMDELARAMGYARASSIQRYENGDEFNKEYFAVDLTQKLANVLVGRGTPPIATDEVWALSLPDARARLLSGMSHVYGESLAIHFGAKDVSTATSQLHKEHKGAPSGYGLPRLQSQASVDNYGHGAMQEAASPAPLPHLYQPNAQVQGRVELGTQRLLPVYGRAVAGINGEFELNGNIIFDVPCPPQLFNVREAYAVQVSGDSMYPRYRDGEIVYCDPTKRVKKGDFVVAQVMVDENNPVPQAFIKMFVRHNASELVLEQFNPNETLSFEHNRVQSVHCIVLSGDIL